MTHFFQLLPLDVQYCVVQHWLPRAGDTDLISALSALDMACCNRSSRIHLLTLSSRVIFNAADHYKYRDGCLVADLLGFVHWIHTRSIALRILCPTEENVTNLEQFATSYTELPFTLPLITCIYMDLDVESHLWLALLLKACPNLTCIESTVQDYEMNELIWKAIGMSHLPNLRAISVRSYSRSISEEMLAALSKFAPQLEELCFDSVPLDHDVWKCIVDHGCPSLRKLRCGQISHSFHTLFTSCPQLTDLTANIRISEIPQVLQASNRKLMRLMVDGMLYIHPLTVVDILERFPFLEEFSISGSYTICRSSRSLCLGSDVSKETFNFADFVRFFCCCSFTKLSLELMIDAPAFLDGSQAFQANLRNAFCQLEDLAIRVHWLNVIAPYLQLGQLTSLQCNGELTRDCILKIASGCSNLKHLSLRTSGFTMTQADLKMLLIGCPALTELGLAGAPKIGYKALLQTLLDTKARLNIIRWGGAGITGEEDMGRFRSLAVERQLIPVPTLVTVFRF